MMSMRGCLRVERGEIEWLALLSRVMLLRTTGWRSYSGGGRKSYVRFAGDKPRRLFISTKSQRTEFHEVTMLGRSNIEVDHLFDVG